MRGRYFANLVLIGLIPLLLVAAGGVFMLLAEKPAPPVAAGSVDSNLQELQTRLSAVSSALAASIQKTFAEMPALGSSPTDEALQAFLTSHPGVSGVFRLSADGRIGKALPAGTNVVDDQYAATDEFKNVKERLFTDGRNPYQFFTDRLGYSAFIFTAPAPDHGIVGAVLNLDSFLAGLDLKGGEAFLLEAGSGRYFVHTNKAKLKEPFNPNQEAWLAKVQDDLKNKQAGHLVNGTTQAAAYHPLGIQAFGLVQIVPRAAVVPPPPPVKDLRTRLHEILMTPLTLSLVVALAWVLLVGSLRLKPTLKPLQDALALVQRASGGGAAVTDADLQKVGRDEPGQIVAAAVQWAQRLEGERDAQLKERDDELRRIKNNLTINLEGKTKELATATQQMASLKSELEQARQGLADKVKELDAMKGMADGLRAQAEQAKAEIAKLKGQMAGHEEKETQLQARLAEADAKLKGMEAKMLKAVSASSAIQVSQVRVAAIKTMAEELKTTLGIIKGYVSSALGSAQGGITEKQQEFLGMVINRSARLEKFINDLMDIYLVEIEQESAPREEINLASEIEGLAFNYQPQADIKGLKIKVEAKPGVPKVPVVRRRFTQLWNILYLQMIKDAPRSATLSIVVEPIGDDVKVSVHDPGLLVKEDHLGKVFDDFYDPKHPASPQLAGTGLKLSLVKTILAAHGGGAVAEKGNPGTMLILTFPSKVRKKEEAAGAPHAPAPAAAKPAASAVPPAPAATTPAPGVKIPSFGLSPSVPKPPTPSPAAAGALDAMLKKSVVPPAPPAPAAATPPPAGIPKPPSPPVPAAPAGHTPPKPPIPLDGLESLIGKTSPPAEVSVPKPAGASPGAAPGPAAAPAPGITPGGLDALLSGKASIPPPPPAPGTAKPVVAPGPGNPPPAPNAAPKVVPKVVPNAMKPAPPPASVLDMNNMDGFKLDEAAAPAKPAGVPPAPAAVPKPAIPPGAPPALKAPLPGMPPAGVPRPPISTSPAAGAPAAPKPPVAPPAPGTLPPPGAPKPPAGGPIVKDLAKDGGVDGELID